MCALNKRISERQIITNIGAEANLQYLYRLLGRLYRCDVILPSLEEYRIPMTAGSIRAAVNARFQPDGEINEVRGWLAGETRSVICRRGDRGYQLEIAGIGRFLVMAPHADIHCVELEPSLSMDRFEEALLGPPMLYSLAIQDVWCLHASAIQRNRYATLFVGASGKGKSTLAEFCSKFVTDGVTRIADDAAPCSFQKEQAFVLPHFPQLKLGQDAQYPANEPEQVPIHTIVVLHPVKPAGVIKAERLTIEQAVHTLIGQTMAVNLFDRELHVSHLKFISRLLGSVPVYRLDYPHDTRQLPEVYVCIKEIMGVEQNV